MKLKLVQAHMETARNYAELSYARRLHVGAIVVKDDRIISIGYNGMPAGWDNNCEDTVLKVVGVAPDGHNLVEPELKKIGRAHV